MSARLLFRVFTNVPLLAAVYAVAVVVLGLIVGDKFDGLFISGGLLNEVFNKRFDRAPALKGGVACFREMQCVQSISRVLFRAF